MKRYICLGVNINAEENEMQENPQKRQMKCTMSNRRGVVWMGHHHHEHTNRNVLLVAFLLTIGFAIFEVISGILLGSIALTSEGIHMTSDGISLLLGFVAAAVGGKIATKRYGFGFHRIETIAAFVNGLFLLIIPIYVAVQAVLRFIYPQTIQAEGMLGVACVGLFVNGIVAWILSKGEQENLNVRAAALHVIADLLSSVATIVAALLILKWNIVWVDPLLSIVVAIIIFIGGWKITKESYRLLMEGVPDSWDTDVIKEDLRGINLPVEQVRMWGMSEENMYVLLSLSNEMYSEEKWNEIKQKASEYFHEKGHVEIWMTRI